MPLDFTALEAQLTRDNDVKSSAATLIAAISAELLTFADGNPKIVALAQRLSDQSDALAAAVAAGTPGA